MIIHLLEKNIYKYKMKIVLTKYHMNNIPNNNPIKAKFKPAKNAPGYYEYSPKPIDYKYMELAKKNVRPFKRYLLTTNPPSKRLLNAANKIGTAYKRYLSRAKRTRTWQRKKALSKFVSVLKTKRVLRRALTLRAAKKRTHVWNKVIREQNLKNQKSNILPPNFTGTANQKYNRARTYKTRIVRWMKLHPTQWNGKTPLYRGISGVERKLFLQNDTVTKKNMSSFSHSLDTALGFANNGNDMNVVLRYVPPVGYVPAINYHRNKKFTSVYPTEEEVLLPPGTFQVTDRRQGKTLILIDVQFTPQV